jgi:hypothetical protein
MIVFKKKFKSHKMQRPLHNHHQRNTEKRVERILRSRIQRKIEDVFEKINLDLKEENEPRIRSEC